MFLETEDFLSHYGVKGMKWGVRRSKEELARASKPAIRSKNSTAGMTEDGVFIAAQGAAVASVVLANAAHTGIQSGAFTSAVTRGKAAVRFGELYKRNDEYARQDYSSSDIMKNVVPGINPKYGSWGTNMNCRRATFAYEMRRRGYDVQATRTSTAQGQDILGFSRMISKNRKDAVSSLLSYDSELGETLISGNTSDSIFGTLSKQPDRSRGELTLSWKTPHPNIPGGKHSVAYEVIKGKAHVFDTQTGREYTPSDATFNMVGHAGYTRLDNKPLNEKRLSRWVR